jgi:hypothetical protein
MKELCEAKLIESSIEELNVDLKKYTRFRIAKNNHLKVMHIIANDEKSKIKNRNSTLKDEYEAFSKMGVSVKHPSYEYYTIKPFTQAEWAEAAERAENSIKNSAAVWPGRKRLEA